MVLIRRYSYQQPLSKVLAENELVEDFTIKEGTSKSLVKVELSKDTSNLMVAYQEINQLINEVMGQKHYQIKFMSKSDNALNQAFYESHHIIYQAQVMGNYPEAAQKVQEAARKQHQKEKSLR